MSAGQGAASSRTDGYSMEKNDLHLLLSTIQKLQHPPCSTGQKAKIPRRQTDLNLSGLVSLLDLLLSNKSPLDSAVLRHADGYKHSGTTTVYALVEVFHLIKENQPAV